MKKATLGTLIVGILLGTMVLAGCGNKEEVAPSTPQDVPPSSAPAGGGGLNPSAGATK